MKIIIASIVLSLASQVKAADSEMAKMLPCYEAMRPLVKPAAERTVFFEFSEDGMRRCANQPGKKVCSPVSTGEKERNELVEQMKRDAAEISRLAENLNQCRVAIDYPGRDFLKECANDLGVKIDYNPSNQNTEYEKSKLRRSVDKRMLDVGEHVLAAKKACSVALGAGNDLEQAMRVPFGERRPGTKAPANSR